MNIIFYRYNSVCEPDFIDAFKQVGVNVIEDDDGMNANLDISTKIDRLGDLIAEYSPLFIFSINYFPFLSIVCDRLGIIYMSETVDCPVFEIYHNSIKNKTNKTFLFDYGQYLSVKDYNPENIFYLPLGSPTERVSKLLGDESRYLYDVSFIGSLYSEKDPFTELKISEKSKDKLMSLMNEQVDKASFGMEWIEDNLDEESVKEIKATDSLMGSTEYVCDLDNFIVSNNYLSYHMAYMERIRMLNSLAENKDINGIHLFTRSNTKDLDKTIVCHGGVKTLSEMPFVFRQSKINLNITMRSIQTGIPQRIWDIMACRGFVLTNYQPELEEYFEIGTHLETFTSIEEMNDKIIYYLKNDSKRETISQNGYEEVCNKHSILMRVINMIKIVTSA